MILFDKWMGFGIRIETLLERCVRAENNGEVTDELMEKLWDELEPDELPEELTAKVMAHFDKHCIDK